jgi:GMP synthase (glutamine-hydrolysing)
MANVAILDCGTSLMRSLLDTFYHLNQTPIVFPSDTPLSVVRCVDPCGIVISGSPLYVNDPNAPRVDKAIYGSLPVLGICYGMQLMATDLGGRVMRMKKAERELINIKFVGQESLLYQDFVDDGAPVWMLHTCRVTQVPDNFIITSKSKRTDISSMEDSSRALYGVQFHPEHRGRDPSVQAGTAIIWNFLREACGV